MNSYDDLLGFSSVRRFDLPTPDIVAIQELLSRTPCLFKPLEKEIKERLTWYSDMYHMGLEPTYAEDLKQSYTIEGPGWEARLECIIPNRIDSEYFGVVFHRRLDGTSYWTLPRKLCYDEMWVEQITFTVTQVR